MSAHGTATGLSRGRGRTGWSYMSGRVTALESALLGRSFFQELISAQGPSGARAVLSKSHYRAAVPTDEAAAAYARSITGYGEGMVAEVLANSPEHAAGRFLELPRRYRLMREAFVRKSAFGAGAEDLEGSLEFFELTQEERESLGRHRWMLRERENPQEADLVAQSLYLDSLAWTVGLMLAAGIEEEGARAMLTDRAVLGCWTAILRSRWNGTAAETVARWFVLPQEYDWLVARTAAQAESDPAEGARAHVSRPAAEALGWMGPARIREDVDAAAAEALRESVTSARREAFGPEPVVAYILALEVEHANLRIAMSAAIDGIDARRAEARLRREYV